MTTTDTIANELETICEKGGDSLQRLTAKIKERTGVCFDPKNPRRWWIKEPPRFSPNDLRLGKQQADKAGRAY